MPKQVYVLARDNHGNPVALFTPDDMTYWQFTQKIAMAMPASAIPAVANHKAKLGGYFLDQLAFSFN